MTYLIAIDIIDTLALTYPYLLRYLYERSRDMIGSCHSIVSKFNLQYELHWQSPGVMVMIKYPFSASLTPSVPVRLYPNVKLRLAVVNCPLTVITSVIKRDTPHW